jgi:hypothetical protein
MKSDISRDTFDPAKHFSRVLMQQGRVTLDADFNEQSAIILHYLRTLARDLIGPYAAPVENGGFALTVDDEANLRISAGRYYVDGILVENDAECRYDEQPDYSLPEDDPFLKELQKPGGDEFWLYLDVWERHVTALDDDSIRESALGGPDTCTRARVVWQVKALPVEVSQKDNAKQVKKLQAQKLELQKQLSAVEGAKKEAIQKKIDSVDAEIARLTKEDKQEEMACDTPLGNLVGLSAASLAARVDPGKKVEDACITPPESKYRGTENQLYRVEIHAGGKAGEATFKWSRDNGSGQTAWLGTSGNDLEVASTRGFQAGDWVELSYDELELHGQTGILVRLANVEGGMLSVDPASVSHPDDLVWPDKFKTPKVRRWNQTETEKITLPGGVVLVTEPSATSDGWIDLEDGVQIQFTAGGVYRSGDYWLIPARVATGGIEWPLTSDGDGKLIAKSLPPHGVEHHYAPLGFVSWKDEKWQIRPCQCEFEPLSSCFVRKAAAADAPGPIMVQPDAPTRVPPAVIATPIAPTEATTKVIATAPSKRARARKKKPNP